jgi:hypothetical protein
MKAFSVDLSNEEPTYIYSISRLRIDAECIGIETVGGD